LLWLHCRCRQQLWRHINLKTPKAKLKETLDKTLYHCEFGISVLMPAHNCGHYLLPAVQSILDQLEVLLELIIIDDRTTDNSLQALPNDPRLRVLQSAGSGIVAALNSGLAQAQYPFIARMDGDDIAMPQRLITQLKYLLDHPDIDICGTQVELFKDEGEISGGYAHYQNWINQLHHHDDIAANFFVESTIPHPSAMLSKNVLLELGKYQNTSWAEDYDLWCRAFTQNKRFGKPDIGPLLQWRDHSDRISRVEERYSKQQFLQCKAKYLRLYLQQKNISSCEIWGTGPTGLKLHDYLHAQGIQTERFVDVNPKLQGRQKRGKPVFVIGEKLDQNQIAQITAIIIVAVSTRGAREAIKNTLLDINLIEMRDFILAA